MPLPALRRPGPRLVGRPLRAVSVGRSTRTALRSASATHPAGFLPSLLLLAIGILLAGGYLALEIGADVIRFRIDEERAAIERLDEQIRTAEARVDEARRIAPLLEGGTLELLINP